MDKILLYADGGDSNNDKDDPDNDCTTIRDTLQQIDLIHRLAEKYKNAWEIVYCADDILPVFRDGKFACLISVEGLHQVANSSSVLRMYHRLGVRCMTFVHSQSTMFANSAVSAPWMDSISLLTATILDRTCQAACWWSDSSGPRDGSGDEQDRNVCSRC
jgi:microsomal dipeptidase-like Zn-dependent dipeptidase